MHTQALCLLLDLFVKHFPNNLSLDYEILLFVDDFLKIHIFIWYSNKKFVRLWTCESCETIWEDAAK